jgi:hypothetical protein
VGGKGVLITQEGEEGAIGCRVHKMKRKLPESKEKEDRAGDKEALKR